MRGHSFLYLLILFLNTIIGNAQNLPYSFPSERDASQMMISHWTVEEGLPSQGLRNFIQAENGYIWITSYDGLIRYDGFDFKVFSSKNTDAFKENICSNVIEDKNNTLWFLSRNRLIFYKNNLFEEMYLDTSMGKVSGPLYVDKNNRLWVTSDKYGVFFIENEKPVIFNDTIIIGMDIRSTTEDKSGNLYFGTEQNKIIKYDGKKFQILTYFKENKKSGFQLLHFFNEKLFWVNDDRELFYYDGLAVKKAALFEHGQFYSFKIDKLGNRWFSTEKGLYKQNPGNNAIKKILLNLNNFTLNIIDETLIDYEGNLWLRLYRKGLIKIRYGKFSSISTLNGLSGKIANTVCESKDDFLLVGFDNGAINKIKDKKVYNFLPPEKTRKARIRHIKKDSKGNLWISTYKGLLKITPSGEEYWFDKNIGFPTDIIRLTYEDSDKNIWVGTKSKGIIKINRDNTFQTFSKLSILEDDQILSIRENTNGNLMVGTAGNGLFILSEDKILQVYNTDNHLNNNVIFDTYIDSEGITWIVTNGGGLNRLDKNKSSFFTSKNGLVNNSPFDIVEDNFGNFWMPFANGVMKVNKNQLNDYANGKIDKFDCAVFDKHDGIKSLGFTPAGHSLKTKIGKIWFPSFNGIEIIDPSNISYNSLPPPVHIEEFNVDNDTLDITNHLIIEPEKRRFNFKFTGICFQSPEKVHFKYMLEGFDKDWIETNSDTRMASYTSLKHGEYTFRVIASNNDGIWNETGTSVSFKVKPFFYETIWFNITIVTAFLGLAFLAYKLRIAQIIKNEEKLKEIVKVRTEKISFQKHEIETQRDEILTINESLIEQKEELRTHKNHLEELVLERTSELEKSKMQAEEADKLKTAFLNNMSHEIRTPMNGILGFIQLLTGKDLEEKQRDKYFKIITKSTNQLLTIVDEIIYISKIQAGVEKRTENKVNINDLLSKIYLHFKSKAEKQNLDFVLTLGLDNHLATIKTDFVKLNHLITIIVDNAFKFTKKGKIELGYKKDDQLVEFFVKDTGIGIDPKMHHKIFHQFRQVDDTNTKEFGGLGLGLTISKAYVELLGGKIWLNSDINKGTTLYFTIPYESVEG